MKPLIIHLLLLSALVSKGQTIAILNMDSIVAYHPLADATEMQHLYTRYFNEVNQLTTETLEMLMYLEKAVRELDVIDLDMATAQRDSVRQVYEALSNTVDSFVEAYENDYARLILEDDVITTLAQQEAVDYLIAQRNILYCDKTQTPDLTSLVVETLTQRSIQDYQPQINALTHQHHCRFYLFTYPQQFKLIQRLCPIYLPF